MAIHVETRLIFLLTGTSPLAQVFPATSTPYVAVTDLTIVASSDSNPEPPILRVGVEGTSSSGLALSSWLWLR